MSPNDFSDDQLDPVYETIDHSSIAGEIKQKPTTTNKFFSKTKDKFVTAVNKFVDNYGNVPKKQTRTSSASQNELKSTSTKRQAPIAEHILRQQTQSQSLTSSNANVTYENTNEILSTPGATRRSMNHASTKTSVIFVHRGVSSFFFDFRHINQLTDRKQRLSTFFFFLSFPFTL